jgi:hypothetical protein
LGNVLYLFASMETLGDTRTHGWRIAAKRGAAGASSSGNEKPTTASDPSEEAPHYHGHRQRLRQRFLEAGSDAVSDYELLELILSAPFPSAISSRWQRRCSSNSARSPR